MQDNLQTMGGISLLLQALPAEADLHVTPEQIERARTLLDERLKGTGALRSVVQVEGTDRIRIEVPGTDALDELRAVLMEHAQFEIIDGGSSAPMLDSYIVTDLEASPSNKTDPQTGTVAKVWHTLFTGDDIDPSGVEILPGPSGSPTIRLTFTKDGARKLAAFTETNIGRCIAFTLDKQVISVPVIRDPIRAGEAAISTTSPVQALKLFVQLKYGPLPISLKELEAKVVPPPAHIG
jgi:protein-export membrane protein SecD